MRQKKVISKDHDSKQNKSHGLRTWGGWWSILEIGCKFFMSEGFVTNGHIKCYKRTVKCAKHVRGTNLDAIFYIVQLIMGKVNGNDWYFSSNWILLYLSRSISSEDSLQQEQSSYLTTMYDTLIIINLQKHIIYDCFYYLILRY